ncbi:MAG: glycerate kinase [Planctomycetota bacterium]
MQRTVALVFDSFKGSIGASALGDALAQRLAPYLPDARIVNFPASDGGDGFAESVGHHFRTTPVTCPVSDPLMRRREAHYVWSPADRLAIIESAQANGLALLDPGERDPLRTTTHGVGELLLDAAGRGAREVVLGVGGSATVDGGTGMARALGFEFLDAAGRPLGPTMADLDDLARIVPPEPHPLADVAIRVASDVRTRLLGERSAVWIYGPQKGGTSASLTRIERTLAHLAELVRSLCGVDHARMPMGGAAGGLAAGLAAFAGAELCNGMALFDELTGLADQVAASDLVITGEGRLDEQSAEGKVVSYVADLAGRADVPVVALCGSAGEHGIPLDGVVGLTDSGLPVEACIARPLDALDRVLPRLVELVRRH